MVLLSISDISILPMIYWFISLLVCSVGSAASKVDKARASLTIFSRSTFVVSAIENLFLKIFTP